MNKKAISTGMTWIIAFPIIIVSTIIFIVAVSTLNGKTNQIFQTSPYSKADMFLTTAFNSFLDRKVEVENKEITILELIEDKEINKLNASDIFKQTAGEHFKEILPYPTNKWNKQMQIGKEGFKNIHPFQLAVFYKDPKIFPSSFSFIGGWDCQTSSIGSITLIRHLKDKEIILCVDEYYYNSIKGGTE